MTREKLLEILGQRFFTIRWAGGCVEMIDQRALPSREEYITIRSVEEMVRAIRSMAIRGAPAVGIAGAMGVALSVVEGREGGGDAQQHVLDSAAMLESARPTAVNLGWGVRRALRRWESTRSRHVEERQQAVIEEAEAILLEDIEMCRKIGENGRDLVPDGATVMTICNAGALATGGHGTALSVLRAAARAGKKARVVVCETRPLLQGARLTSWELVRDGFDVTLICDSAAGCMISSGAVHAVIVGADRIAMNGDFANKIGTCTLAVLAARNGVSFYVAAPTSTLDPGTPDGRSIAIEERDPSEVTELMGIRIAAAGVKAMNPAFDVTPASLVRKIITEKGVYDPGDVMNSL